MNDQLTRFLSGPALNGRQPYVTVGDTPSVSADDDDTNLANLLSFQCESIEALVYEENASFP